MYRAIRHAMTQAHIRTISVDIFDTILLRSVHPESARFFRIAEAWQEVLQEVRVPVTTLVTMREEATLVLRALSEDRGGDGEATLSDIVDGVIHLLEIRFQLSCDEKKRKELKSALIDAELNAEEGMLTPNRRLIALLKGAKAEGKKIYFLSDMYMSGEHIHRLLRRYECDALFDGGVTSSDIGANKGTGHAYEQMILKQGFGAIDRKTHLHIGDHPYCDVLVPRTLCIASVQYVPRKPLRTVLRYAGQIRRSLLQYRSIRAQYRSQIRRSMPTTRDERIAYKMGTLLAPGILTYISFLELYTERSKERVVFLSRESSMFSALLRGANTKAPHIILPKINRHLVMSAVLHHVLRSPLSTHDERLSRLIIDRFNEKNFPSFLQSLDVSDDDSAFLLRILRFTQYTKKDSDRRIIIDALRRVYAKNDQMRARLSGNSDALMSMLQAEGILQCKRICIADVGWLGSMQFLLEIFFEAQGIDIEIHGVYLGTKASESGASLSPKRARGVLFSPARPKLTGLILVECLWEYALETEHTNSVKRALYAGLLTGVDFCKNHPTISASALYHATLPSLIRFMNLPTKAEVRVIGAELFDLGLGMKGKQPILEATVEAPLRLRPRRTLRRTKDQLWQAGFLVQKKLKGALLLRFLLRLLRAWKSR